jgi:hypothetical protein
LSYGFATATIKIKQLPKPQNVLVKTDNLQLYGECGSSWSLADSPKTEFSQDYDSSATSSKDMGDIFSSLFKTTSPTAAC